MRDKILSMRCRALGALAALSLPLLAALFPSCSDGEGGVPGGEEKAYATLTISLGSMDNLTPSYTKAENDVTNPKEDDSKYEHYIEDWWLVISKKEEDGSFLVDRVISNDPKANNADDNSETSVEVELEIDATYKFYALANLNDLVNGSVITSGLTTEALKGSEFKPETLEAAMKEMSEFDAAAKKNQATATPHIPMTSYGYEETIRENPDPLEIPLIRLLGKVSLTVNNTTEETIKLSSLKMNHFRTNGNIFLFPYDVASNTQYLLKDNMADEYAPKFPGEDVTGKPTGTLTFLDEEQPIEITNGQIAGPYTLYANETDMGTDFEIVSKIEGKSEDPQPTRGMDFIRRNDWLQIPIVVQNVESTIKIAQNHMPIGGLPDVRLFKEGVNVAIVDYNTANHGGDITIEYAIIGASSFAVPVLAHYEGPTYKRYTSAVLISDKDDMLINKPADNAAAPWLDKKERVFPLTKVSDTEGSFTVTAQELGKVGARAEIELTLAIQEKGNESKVSFIPYTIVIDNSKEK